MSTTAGGGDLAKLMVPQLKALCKERRIVGYSKLGKAALLQKLALTQTGTTTIQSNDQAVHNLHPVFPIQAAISEARASEPTGWRPSLTYPAEPGCEAPPSPRLKLGSGVVSLNHTHSTQTAKKVSSAKQSAQPKPLPVSGSANSVIQSLAVDQSSPTLADERPQPPDENHGTKRVRVSAAVFASAKKQKSSAVNAGSIHPNHADSSSTKSPFLSAGTLRTRAVLTSVTGSQRFAAGCPPRRSSISNAVLSAPRHTCLVQTEAGSSAKRDGRFRPLVLAKPLVVASTPVNYQRVIFNNHPADEIACIFSGIFSLEVAPLSTPSFVNITLPPNLSDRRRVQKWAVILCALSDQDRQTCVLVSRAFRYAGRIIYQFPEVLQKNPLHCSLVVYLSAAHILAQKYYGRRLDQIKKRHPQNMTNMWPYLRQRQNEVAFWRQAFQNSFVGRYSSALGIEPLSARLWTSPDDEKQVMVALRYALLIRGNRHSKI